MLSSPFANRLDPIGDLLRWVAKLSGGPVGGVALGDVVGPDVVDGATMTLPGGPAFEAALATNGLLPIGLDRGGPVTSRYANSEG
ncbi:MAG: hypothetical protein F4X97_12530 [Boseongicola sp. SB0662_bin_57]|nr:hypothetical protein [Boseongicola sp. SB0662_bin_57]